MCPFSVTKGSGSLKSSLNNFFFTIVATKVSFQKDFWQSEKSKYVYGE
jgi:hypothetical protein